MRSFKSLLVALLVPAVFAVGCTRVVHEKEVMVGTKSDSSSMKTETVTQTWTPASGYQNKVTYRYYPADELYFNPGTSEWVWSDNGSWHRDRRPPVYYRTDQSEQFVIVDIEGNRPEVYHSQIIRTYPRTYVIQNPDKTVIRERTESRSEHHSITK